MISSLRGTLLARSARAEVVVEVSGVGYRVAVAPATVAALGSVGSTVLVHTHLAVREDSLSLFGFLSVDERDCFEALIGAHGVGPGLAMAILSVHAPTELRRVLIDGDLDALVLVPGVGRKTAARLLIELKSRLGVPDVDHGDLPGEAPSPRAEVRSALAGLGYDGDEVTDVLRELPAEGSIEDLLRLALKLLATNR